MVLLGGPDGPVTVLLWGADGPVTVLLVGTDRTVTVLLGGAEGPVTVLLGGANAPVRVPLEWVDGPVTVLLEGDDGELTLLGGTHVNGQWKGIACPNSPQVDREDFNDAADDDIWDKWHCKQQILLELTFLADLKLELRAAKPTFFDLKERNLNEFRQFELRGLIYWFALIKPARNTF